MRWSSREMTLAWLTMATLLGGATFLLGRTKVGDWKKIDEERSRLEEQIAISELLVAQRETWAARLDQSIMQLPVYPEGQQVTPKLLQAVEALARENNLRLATITPDRESSIGDVYEVAIKCTWQGDLEAAIRFLFALQNQGAMYKVRKLTVAPTGKSDQLKGGFTVDCAYTRGEGSAGGSTLEVVPIPDT